MEKVWLETEITVDTVNWKGEPIKLSNVKAIKDVVTGEVLVHPSNIAKAEVKQIADCFNLEPERCQHYL